MIHRDKYIVYKSLAEVREIFSNLKAYGDFHPLIHKVTPLEKVVNDDFTFFKIHERPYSWLPIKISYFALVCRKDQTIEYTIKGIPFSQPKVSYQLTSLSSHSTQLDYKLNIKGLPIIRSILKKKMVQAQEDLIVSINKA